MNEKEKYLFLDIAMNLNRLGEWVTEDYKNKKGRIDIILSQNREYINKLNISLLSDQSQKTFRHFLKIYPSLEEQIRKEDKWDLVLGENLMTWGNILTHKASLII
ncbi:hypothetical protein M1145_00825 [Patescibacteria group bacterium]|nr:hypothetical protein [Patescibacteria group bacterium]